jgi:sulfatase-like protein
VKSNGVGVAGGHICFGFGSIITTKGVDVLSHFFSDNNVELYRDRPVVPARAAPSKNKTRRGKIRYSKFPLPRLSMSRAISMRTPFIQLLASLCLICGHVRAVERPNIVFVLADDLGNGDLGCYGGSIAPTPQIDRLAKDGTRFTRFYAASPICSPSRCGR